MTSPTQSHLSQHSTIKRTKPIYEHGSVLRNVRSHSCNSCYFALLVVLLFLTLSACNLSSSNGESVTSNGESVTSNDILGTIVKNDWFISIVGGVISSFLSLVIITFVSTILDKFQQQDQSTHPLSTYSRYKPLFIHPIRKSKQQLESERRLAKFDKILKKNEKALRRERMLARVRIRFNLLINFLIRVTVFIISNMFIFWLFFIRSEGYSHKTGTWIEIGTGVDQINEYFPNMGVPVALFTLLLINTALIQVLFFNRSN